MLQVLRHQVVLSLLAAFATASYDLISSATAAGEAIDAFAWLRILELTIGFYGVLGLSLGCVWGFVAHGAHVAFGGSQDLPRKLFRLRDQKDLDCKVAAWTLAGVLGSLLLALWVYGFVLRFALSMARKPNAALATALWTLAGLLPASMLSVAIFPAARSFVRRLPSPRTLILVGSLAVAAVVGAWLALSTVEKRALDFGPAKCLGVFFLAWMGFGLAMNTAWFKDRIATARIARLLVLALVVGIPVAFVGSWMHFGDEAHSVAFINQESKGLKSMLGLVHRAFDRDGDGFASRFGGGDCDDNNPRINPLAAEIAGDGVDQDCDGVDPPRVSVRPRESESAAVKALRWEGNFLFITIDAMRADRLNERHAPRAFALSKNAVTFVNAYAQAPNTPRSFPSFLASRFPSEIKWWRPFAPFSPFLDVPENTTFFQALARGGVSNVGVFSSFYTEPQMGIARGFARWSNEGARKPIESDEDVASPRIVPRVIAEFERLSRSGERFALWTYLFEPHWKYLPHPEYPASTARDASLEDRYNGEVFFSDLHLGRILDALEATGLANSTAIFLFADHGETLGERQIGGRPTFFHGHSIYDEILRVPFVIRVPGVAPRTVQERVMLVDLAPTVLALANLPRPPSFRGRSLLPALLGESLPEYPVYAEMLPSSEWGQWWRSFAVGNTKLIHRRSENSYELYALDQDPGERKNLAFRDPHTFSQMRQLMATFTVDLPALPP